MNRLSRDVNCVPNVKVIDVRLSEEWTKSVCSGKSKRSRSESV